MTRVGTRLHEMIFRYINTEELYADFKGYFIFKKTENKVLTPEKRLFVMANYNESYSIRKSNQAR